MRWSPKFNFESCNAWLNSLRRLNFLNVIKKDNNKIGHYQPPFNVLINQNIYTDIVSIYVPHEEKGGLMFASLSKENDDVILNIERVIEIQNDVELIFPGESKKNSYFPNEAHYIKELNDNFSNKTHDKILIPIHFHTHPTSDIEDDIWYFHNQIRALDMSRQDIKVSKIRHIDFNNNFKLFYLNAIITGNEDGHRIIFYGHLVTPDNYMSEKGKQVIDVAKEYTKDLKNEGWELALKIAVFAGMGLTTIAAPLETLTLINMFTHLHDKKEFWGKLENGTTIIKIPFRNLIGN